MGGGGPGGQYKCLKNEYYTPTAYKFKTKSATRISLQKYTAII